ncbi:MAG: sigma-70 family RNA polymerase sigma factor [Kiritimatiellae bacterium]|nr:sigma-70 family RNA polymerase sigma factor [Kiritimatiellia bacterium]
MAEETREEEPSRFPPTRWTLVAHARNDSDTQGLAALEELLAAYGPVLRLYLVRSLRLPPEQAEDLVQEFMARRILRERLLDHADRARGRFRSFLLKCFLNFVRSEQRKQRAAKRGPPSSHMVNLDEHAAEIPDPRPAHRDFDALWARQVIGAALARMEQECARKNRKDIWVIFEQRVLNPIFSGDAPRSYEELVAELGLKSPLHASNLLITAKRSFQRALEAVVRETVSSESAVAAELAELKRALAGAVAPTHRP